MRPWLTRTTISSQPSPVNYGSSGRTENCQVGVFLTYASAGRPHPHPHVPDVAAGGHLDLSADEPLAPVDAAGQIALEPVAALGAIRTGSREDPQGRAAHLVGGRNGMTLSGVSVGDGSGTSEGPWPSTRTALAIASRVT